MQYALVGNQNCGKTTLFNRLCGATQHVGNFPGVTVDKKEGTILGTRHRLIDLPGSYSLLPFTPEEQLTRDFLLTEASGAILNVVDADNLYRNLYLTLQLITLGLPMILVLNRIDAIEAKGGGIDKEGLATALGIPVFAVCATRGEGIEELKRGLSAPRLPFPTPRGAPPQPSAFLAFRREFATHDPACTLFSAEMLFYGKENLLPENISRKIDSRGLAFRGNGREELLIAWRYATIERLLRTVLTPQQREGRRSKSDRLDALLLSSPLAVPLMLLIVGAVFFLTFGKLGRFLCEIPSRFFSTLSTALAAQLVGGGVAEPLADFLTVGVLGGIGSVLSFLPVILLLFFFLSLLEDSGYMARVACIFDAPMRRLGLSGKSVVPFLIGFGCTVPAVMATRTIKPERGRRTTILLLPFISCSAKLPVYLLLAAAFFPKHAALTALLLYFSGILAALTVAAILHRTLPDKGGDDFTLELPAYRMPTLKNTLLLLREKAVDFLKKAFTVIFLASLVIWLLGSITPRFGYTADPQASLLAGLGRLLLPLFRPIGICDWRAVAALLAGVFAKESIISTLSVLSGGAGSLTASLPSLFLPGGAVSYLTFILFYTPCIASLSIMRRELGSRKAAAGIAGAQGVLALLLSTLVYQVGRCFL